MDDDHDHNCLSLVRTGLIFDSKNLSSSSFNAVSDLLFSEQTAMQRQEIKIILLMGLFPVILRMDLIIYSIKVIFREEQPVIPVQE